MIPQQGGVLQVGCEAAGDENRIPVVNKPFHSNKSANKKKDWNSGFRPGADITGYSLAITKQLP
jgi:hypothetical protein